MRNDIDIGDSLPADMSALERLYAQAFPDEDLLPLVRDLLSEEGGVLSLVARVDEELAGHIVFTACRIAGQADTVALLGPLAVASTMQKQGIGGALIRAGLDRLKAEGTAHVLVLGDPAYYGRFGFRPEMRVSPPYPLPEAWVTAWQSVRLGDGKPVRGTLAVPRPWQQEALWLP